MENPMTSTRFIASIVFCLVVSCVLAGILTARGDHETFGYWLAGAEAVTFFCWFISREVAKEIATFSLS